MKSSCGTCEGFPPWPLGFRSRVSVVWRHRIESSEIVGMALHEGTTGFMKPSEILSSKEAQVDNGTQAHISLFVYIRLHYINIALSLH